jgi:hemerythrin
MSEDWQPPELPVRPAGKLAFTVWDESMATGYEAVDQQHRDLLDKVNDLLAACRERRMAGEIPRLIWFLKRYVRKHFRDEEQLQLDHGYPGYPAHKAQHDWFYAEVRSLELKYSSEGASTILVIESLYLMCNWLHAHFKDVDQILVNYLHDKGSDSNF